MRGRREGGREGGGRNRMFMMYCVRWEMVVGSGQTRADYPSSRTEWELEPRPSLQLEISVARAPPAPQQHHNPHQHSGWKNWNISENIVKLQTSTVPSVDQLGGIGFISIYGWKMIFYNLIWRTKLSKWSRFKLDSFVLPQPWTAQSVSKVFREVNLSTLAPTQS